MKVLLVVESTLALELIHPSLPKDWYVVTLLSAMPIRGIDVIVVPNEVVVGTYRSPQVSKQIVDWYRECVVTALLPGGKILRT